MTLSFYSVLAGLGALLACATATAECARRRWPSPETRQVCRRVYTWWYIVAVVGSALAVGGVGVWLLVAGLIVGASLELRRLTVGQPGRRALLALLVAVACLHLGLLYYLAQGHKTALEPRLAVLTLLLLIELNDVAQYLWGRALGRHPLAARLSPHKTVEGAVGGVVTTALLACALRSALGLAAWPALALGGGVAVLGIAGDLAVSGLKRAAGVKDSGTLLPGHGGLLDRLDSFLLAGPGAAWALNFLWRHT